MPEVVNSRRNKHAKCCPVRGELGERIPAHLFSIQDDRGLPSWKRKSKLQDIWNSNRHVIRPHLIALGVGVVTFGLLFGPEVLLGSAHASIAGSNPPPIVLDQSKWGPVAPVPAPMPRRWVAPKGILCPETGSAGSSSKIHTLELRLPASRCALTFVPVGLDFAVSPPGE